MKRKPRGATLRKFIKDSFELYGTSKISREQAEAANLMFYWTGKPCSNGHLTFRYTSDYGCRVCQHESNTLKNYGPKDVGFKGKVEDKLYELELSHLEDLDYSFD